MKETNKHASQIKYNENTKMDITATNNQQNNRVDPPSHSKMLNLDVDDVDEAPE